MDSDFNKNEITVILSHGKESGPHGEKIVALADVATRHGYKSISIDYRGMDDPEIRVAHLLDEVSAIEGSFALVGSSMGGYVSLRASQKVKTSGLFLMAPAIGLPKYNMPFVEPRCHLVTIVHAWDDEIIPVDGVISYAKQHKATLHLVNSDHRLSSQIPLLTKLFDNFLISINKHENITS